MTIWFTADTHFNHENIVEYSNRPFRDLDHMTEQLILNWNRRVAKGDIIYHLGDFALSWGKKHQPVIDGILSQLHGQKWLITGNHDRDEVKNSPHWVKVLPYHEIKVDRGGKHKQRIVLFHYSLRVWNQMHRGSWMLFAHSHGNLPRPPGRTKDVGVDPNNQRPISIDEVEAEIGHLPIETYDHHIRQGNYTESMNVKAGSGGTLISVSDYIAQCRGGVRLNVDGFGHAVKDDMMDLDELYPSEWRAVPADATFILWFNT